MPPSLHAILGASSAKRWLACTPSARLNEKFNARYGQKESEFAREGTKAHALGEIKIRRAFYEADGMSPEKMKTLSPSEREAYLGINEYRYTKLREELGEIPPDMEHATDSYCDVVMEKYLRAKEQDPAAELLLETRLNYSEWVPSGFGTGDAIIVSDSLLEICDYKHGKGIPVDAVGNPQLRLYALGAYQLFSPIFEFPGIRMTIIQPRLESVTEDTMTTEDLLSWAESIREPARKAWLGEGEFVPGEHCRFCAAKAVCSARVAQGLRAAQYGLEAPGMIPDEQIPQILEVLDDLLNWGKDFKEYVQNQAIHGQQIRGYKLVHGKKPNRQWSDTSEVEATLLRAGYPVEMFREERLRPPGEIEKKIGKAAFTALLGGLVSQGEGALTLVPESDKRIAVSSADQTFEDLLN